MSEQSSSNYDDDSESIMNESEAYDSDNKEVPESLKMVFSAKEDNLPKKINASIFTKNRGSNIDTSNVEAEKMRKAEEVFAKMNIFKDIQIVATQIKPMNSVKLDKKDRQQLKEMNAGKAWGSMEKVELTEELKNDLKAIKFRN
jgi:hypothetical protein